MALTMEAAEENEIENLSLVRNQAFDKETETRSPASLSLGRRARREHYAILILLPDCG